MYVYKPHQSLHLSQIVVNRCTFTLLLYQLTMLGVLSLKLFPFLFVIVIPIIGTILFRYYIKKRFGKLHKYVPLRHMVYKEKESEKTLQQLNQLAAVYHQPELTPVEELEKPDSSLIWKAESAEEIFELYSTSSSSSPSSGSYESDSSDSVELQEKICK